MGRGVIVIVVTDLEGIVVDFRAISGYTVTARFKPFKQFIGLTAKEVEAKIHR